MSLPEILSREEEQVKLLIEVEKKLESIIGLMCGTKPVNDAQQREGQYPANDGFISSALFTQEIVSTKLNNLHIRLDDFRSMLGWSEELAKKQTRGPEFYDKLHTDLVKSLKNDLPTQAVGYPGLDKPNANR